MEHLCNFTRSGKLKIFKKRTKIRILNSNVKSVLLYACETWRVTHINKRRIQTFRNRCLRRILQIRWQETISNEDLWEQTRQKPIEMQIKTRTWRWIGHTLRKTEGAVEKQSTRLEPAGCLTERTSQKNKTWREVKTVAAQRERWKSFTDALCSKRNDRN